MTSYLNTEEAAKYLRVAPSTVRAWVCKGILPVRKHGRRSVFCTDDLDQWSRSTKVCKNQAICEVDNAAKDQQ